MPMQQPLAASGLTVVQAATALDVSTDTIRRRIRSGDLAARHDSRGRWRVALPADAPVALQIGRVELPAALEGPNDELADLRARIGLLERERGELIAELAARRREVEALLTLNAALVARNGRQTAPRGTPAPASKRRRAG